jgi:predicted NBD/HSP70 family sugar kinase
MNDRLRLGVDLGGTKTEAVVVRLPAAGEGEAAPEELARLRVPTGREGGYEHVLATVAGVIRDVARQAGLGALPAIGVGMPGGVTRDERGEVVVKNSNTTCLNGRPFRQDLARRIGQPIAFANDANCFALAEALHGAGRVPGQPAPQVVFGVILGTGVGGGVILGGKIWDGAQGIAGEWGHVVLEEGGPPCYCGRRGCVERYLSGPAIEEAYAARAGVRRPLREIAEREGDPDRAAVFGAVAERFGRAMATVINILDPEVVVLGGGASNLDLFYGAGTEAVGRWVFNDRLQTRIVRNQLGDSAGVLGAALLP